MKATSLAAFVIGCGFEAGRYPIDAVTRDEEIDVAPPEACGDVAGPSGIYMLPTGPEYCETSIDGGGGWTLIASFVNGDGARNWSTREAILDAAPLFGSLANHTTADYKSSGYGALVGNDILVVTEEYAFAFHTLLGNASFSAFVSGAWPSTCATTWMREGASFTQGLQPAQNALLGFSVRGADYLEPACFPFEEASALVFLAGDVQSNGLGNSPYALASWGTDDISLPKLANLTSQACTPTAYPCNSSNVNKPWDSFDSSVRAQRALLFVR